MATTLRAESFSSSLIQEVTRLDVKALAAATALTVESNQGLAVGDFLYLGTLGQERCEKAIIASLSSVTGVVVGATSYDHQRFESVTKISSDQIKFYRAANVNGSVPDDSLFSVIVTRNIDPDQLGTFYTDSTGGSGYWYKYTYFNSATSAETPLADASAVRGSDFAHYATVSQIRGRAGFQNNLNLSDVKVDEHRRAAEAEINSALISRYTVPFAKPVPEMVHRITVQLGAGLLLADQYPMSREGMDLVKDARALLMSLQAGSTSLVDYQGTAVAEASASASSWPNETTEEADPIDGGSKRIFRMGDFGNRF